MLETAERKVKIMKFEDKKKIRKEIYALGYQELLKLIETESKRLRELESQPESHVTFGPAACKKAMQIHLRMSRSAYKIKLAAKRLEIGCQIDARKNSRDFIEGIMMSTEVPE